MWQEEAERQWNVATGDKERAELSDTVADPGTESSWDTGSILVRNESKGIFFGSGFVFLFRPNSSEKRTNVVFSPGGRASCSTLVSRCYTRASSAVASNVEKCYILDQHILITGLQGANMCQDSPREGEVNFSHTS